eukprot:2001311-Prymnesium_polylepis.2
MSAAVAPSSARASAADALSDIFSSHPPVPLRRDTVAILSIEWPVFLEQASSRRETGCRVLRPSAPHPNIPERGRSRDGYTATM